MANRGYELRRRGLKAEYNAYINMLHRCLNPNHKAFPRYGGVGILVDPIWTLSFDYFYLDMGHRPKGDGTRKGEYSLDRIDPHGPYSKDNCRWATRKQQQRNQRSNALYMFRGKLITIAEIAEMTGMNGTSLGARLRKGIPAEEAVNPARRPSKIKGKKYPRKPAA